MAQQYGSSDNISVQLEGPFGSAGGAVKLTQVLLPAADWKGAESPFAQTVTVEGISIGSMVQLQPDAGQLEQLRMTALTAENDGGEVTVYALGRRPAVDLTLQASITEVIA